MLITAKPSENLKNYKQQRAIQTEKAKTQINRFIKYAKKTDCNAMYYLYALLNHGRGGVNDGAADLERLTENLIRHFAVPAHTNAWAGRNNDPKELIDWLLQMQWFFREMQNDLPMAYVHRYELKNYASEEEIEKLTQQYTEQADIKAAAHKAYKKHNAQAA